MILKFHDEKGTEIEFLVIRGLATYSFESLRVLMGQMTTLMGLDAFDMEMTWSWIEPPLIVLLLKGSRDAQNVSPLEFIS